MTKAKRKKIFISKPKTPYRKGYGCPYDKRILYCGLGCCEDCRIPNVYEQGKKDLVKCLKEWAYKKGNRKYIEAVDKIDLEDFVIMLDVALEELSKDE